MSRRTPFHPFTRIAIVTLLVAVLATLLFPLVGTMGWRYGQARPWFHLSPISQAMLAYAEDQGGRWPSAVAVGTRVAPVAWAGNAADGLSVVDRWGPDLGIVHMADRAGTWSTLAWDWSAPWPSAADRPLIGQRDPSLWGGDGIHVATVDGRVVFVRASPGHGETPGDVGSPIAAAAVTDAGDDLFTRTGDDPGMDLVGGGSATRCFLK